MGANTKIEWTDHTINFWEGCTKVSPGCDNCYAKTLSDRFNKPSLWGVGAKRLWRQNAAQNLFKLKSGRVFIQSMSDIADSEVPLEWFKTAWEAIKASPQVKVQLLTKRLSVLLRRLVAIGETHWPKHVGLMISVVNQEEADRDVPKLLAADARWQIPFVGLSCEPLLGPLNLKPWLEDLDWVIVGGESGPNARPMHPDWARDIMQDCYTWAVPYFFKQWGEWMHEGQESALAAGTGNQRRFIHIWPDGSVSHKLGKLVAGNLLDRASHQDFPRGF
jgi:protein gp37